MLLVVACAHKCQHWPVLFQSGDFHGLIGWGSRDCRLKGLGKFIIRLDMHLSRLGTSGLSIDIRVDPNLTGWQTSLGLGRTGRRDNGSFKASRLGNWDGTEPRNGLGMVDWDWAQSNPDWSL